jgi:hypothetical protein
MTVAEAAKIMGLSKSQAQRRLNDINERVGGRLLRKVGDKRMPTGNRASKFLVSPDVLREWMTPQLEIDIQARILLIEQKADLALERSEATRRYVRPLLRQRAKEQRTNTA